MRGIIGVFCALLLSASPALGKSLYVKCHRTVLLRADTSPETKIVSPIRTGQPVTFLSEEGEFYFVVLPNGTKGYVRKSHMTDETPADIRLQELEQQIQQRVEELVEARTHVQQKELMALEEERAQLQAATQQAEATAQLQSESAAQLQIEKNKLTGDTRIRWFVAGASVFFAGWILGRWGGNRGRSNRLRL